MSTHKIIHGKSEIELKQFEDNSIDSCITDPPYGLEFMGKNWDKFGGKPIDRSDVNPAMDIHRYFKGNKPIYSWDLHKYQEFCYEWATELYRVLKPGAYILVFGGTRTYHRMACAVEDAGFEVRDMIEWIYGCLSEDTEILVDGKWVLYHKNIYKHHALCYDIEKDELYQGEIQRVFEYEYDDTAYRIKSDFTDQIVSRNHRCIVERSGRKLFAEAETLECQEDISFLESVSSVSETFFGLHKRAGNEKQILLGCVCGKIPFVNEERKDEEDGGAEDDTNTLFSLWKRALGARLLVKESKKSNLFSALQWGFKRRGMEKTRSQRQGKLEARKRSSIKSEDDWRKQPRMERWCNLFQNAWELCWCKICEMSARVYGHGSQGWLCNGTSPIGCTGVETGFEEGRSGASQRPRPDQQFINKSSAIREQSNTQTLRERSGCRTTLATITPFHYKGLMWCIQVPTGAFVARRNGKIFITGNSGFPKSLDISKSLDKMNGKEREVIGKNPNARDTCGNINICKKNGSRTITTPASEEAIQWNGWGTGMKPAHEPILLARKPISEKNIAANVLKWGVGGINVDGCRVTTNDSWGGKTGAFGSVGQTVYGRGHQVKGEMHQQGRFPSNLILECCCEDDEIVEGKAISSDGGMHETSKFGNGWITEPRKNVGYGEEKCLIHTNPNCVCKMLDEQSGELKSGDLLTGHKRGSGISSYDGGGGIIKANYGGDKGGASRFFYQAKASQKERWFYCTICKQAYPMKERDKHIHNAPEKTKYQYLEFHPTQKPLQLIQYLIRLITPPGGTVIDPFLGSGTGLIAAEREGFNAIGIDSNLEYCLISNQRLKNEIEQEQRKLIKEQSTIQRIGF